MKKRIIRPRAKTTPRSTAGERKTKVTFFMNAEEIDRYWDMVTEPNRKQLQSYITTFTI